MLFVVPTFRLEYIYIYTVDNITHSSDGKLRDDGMKDIYIYTHCIYIYILGLKAIYPQTG